MFYDDLIILEQGNDEKKRDGFKGQKMIILPTESFTTYVKHPLVKRLYLTDVGFFPQASHHFRERKEGIDEYIFIYCTEGQGVIIIEDKKYILEANNAFCIPRHRSHIYYASDDDPWSILWVHFKGDDVSFYPLDECKIVSLDTIHASNRMLFLFELLFRVLESSYTLGNFIYITHVLSLILSETYNREKKNTAAEYNKHVTNVIRYMQMNLSGNLTLEQLAEEFGLSKSYLNAIFKKCTQHAPLDFYIHLKMKEACKLLKMTDLYIYEVAQSVGYRDQYHFSRVFKRVVGVSPKEYKYNDFYHYKE